MISAKATIPSTFSEAWMYWPIHVAKIDANSNDTHTPAMSDTIEITWLIKPFLMPFTKAGMKHIKRMMSTMLIISSIIRIFAD
jgi:hypothetical protein